MELINPPPNISPPSPPRSYPIPSGREIQNAIDEVVWFHGDDPLYWSGATFQGLAAKGILPSDLTRRRLVVAQEKRDEELNRRIRDAGVGIPIRVEFKEALHDPVKRDTEDGGKEITREKVIKKLMDLKRARQRPYNEVDDAENSTNPEGDIEMSEETVVNVLKVKECDFRSALKSLGFDADNPEKWSLSRLRLKIASSDKFDNLLEGAKKEPTEQADRDLLKNISDILSEGGEVEIAADNPPQTQYVSGNGHDGSKPKRKKQIDPDVGVTDMVKTMSRGKVTKRHTPGAGVVKHKEGPRESRGGTLMDLTIQVMKKHRKPMKVKQIWETIEKEGLYKGTGTTPWSTIAASIYTEIRDMGEESRFEKGEERGTFQLKK